MKLDNLLHLLRRKSWQCSPHYHFLLSSGNRSQFYIDCKMAVSDPEGARLIGEVFFDLVKDLDVQGIGGLAMGAIPIAVATSLISLQKGKPIKSFFIRKVAKDHGTEKCIEGDIQQGDKVVIVDDVVTTGNSVIDAIRAARLYGLEVVKVIVLVEREEGGEANIKKHIPMESVFRISDLTD